MYNVLITGAAGFVGSKLRDVLSREYDVYSLDCTKNRDIENYIKCDITDKQDVINKLEKYSFDYVIHCSAIAHNDEGRFVKEDFDRVNVGGTKNLIDFFNSVNKKVKRFILFSTISVYGERNYKGVVDESNELNPITDYAISKYNAENICLNEGLIPVTILRFSAIYSKGFLKDIEKRVYLNERIIFKIGDGKHRYSFCSIENVLEVVKLILDSDSDGESQLDNEIYNIADNETYSVLDLIDFFRKYYNKNTMVLYVPKGLIKIIFSSLGMIYKSKRDYLDSIYWKLAEDNIYSIEKAKKFLGYNPRWNFKNTILKDKKMLEDDEKNI